MRYVNLDGSFSPRLKSLDQRGDRAANRNREAEVLVELRRKPNPPPQSEYPLSAEQFAAAFSASDEDVDMLLKIARRNRLRAEVSRETRTVLLRGKLRDILNVFPANVRETKVGDKFIRYRTDDQQIPAELEGRIVSIAGIDERPEISPHVAPATQPAQSIPPFEIAQKFGFVQGDGAGASVAFLEFGGGFEERDITASLARRDVRERPAIFTKTVGRFLNRSGQTRFHDEAALDLQIFASIAPRAEIRVYLSGTTMAEIQQNIRNAVHDNPAPTLISISYGAPEDGWQPQYRTSIELRLEEAQARGTAVLVSSGDHGAGEGDFAVEFPGISAFAVACGGTQMADPANASDEEVVWNDGTSQGSGGGFSKIFPAPTFQGQVINNTSRGIPDVAGYASASPGYEIFVGGEPKPMGGTSAVPPLYAGLLAGIAGPKLLPNLNKFFYENQRLFKDITQGHTQLGFPGVGHQAATGWDPCTGLGRIKGDEARAALEPLLIPRPEQTQPQ